MNDNKEEWFSEWFDTKYYHILYKDRDDSEAEHFIQNLVANFNITEDDFCLDLACGKGRHAKFLQAITNSNVLGVDLSAQSIERASEYENDKLKFAVHDMRDVIEDAKFDHIFNLFTSFGYFDTNEDNLKVLNSLNKMLAEKGTLLIDFMNSKKVTENLVLSEIKVVDDISFKISRSFDGTHIFKNIKFSDNGRDYNYTERVQGLMRSDFQHLLELANFEIISTFGDFNLNPFDETSSDRLIIKAIKK